jgi:hypothetical protein
LALPLILPFPLFLQSLAQHQFASIDADAA